jgi:hypothetical protein
LFRIGITPAPQSTQVLAFLTTAESKVHALWSVHLQVNPLSCSTLEDFPGQAKVAEPSQAGLDTPKKTLIIGFSETGQLYLDYLNGSTT